VIDGQTVPVFDELAVLERSNTPTWQVTVTADSEALDALANHTAQLDLGMDDWSRLRLLCRDCSMGNPDVGGHVHDAPREDHTRLGMAGTAVDLRGVLDTWATAHRGVVVRDVELVWDADGT
jgi:hypothetical protein